MTTGVVIADPTPFVRLAVRMALTSGGLTIIAEVADGPSALQATLDGGAGALLIDEDLDPGMDVVREVCRTAPETAVIVLASDLSDASALAAIRAGACGFLPKATSPDRLAAIVTGALDGEAAIPRRIVRQLLTEISGRAHTRGRRALSERERQVLDLLAQGLSDRFVGERLGVSDVTVRRHTGAAMQKLHAASRHEAIERYRAGLGSMRRRTAADPG